MKSAPPRQDPRNQFAAGGFLAIWSAAGWWSAAGTPALWSDEFGADPGPGLLPTLALTILTMGALILLLDGIRRTMAERPRPGYWRSLRRHTLVPVLFVGSLLAYVPAIRLIGFIPASGLFAFVWMAALGFKNSDGGSKVPLLQAAAGTLIGVGLIYFIFVYLIGVPLR